MSVAIIPARGGSRRIPQKNIRPFLGKPIIAYPIAAALASRLFDRIIVSTDSAEIAGVAQHYGAEAWIRPPELANDTCGTPEVMGHTLWRMSYEHDDRPLFACCIYATAAMLDPLDLRRGLDALKAGEGIGARYSFGMGTEPPKDAGQWYWARSQVWIMGLPLVAPHSIMLPVDERRCCDINVPEDWPRAEAMYRALHEKESA